MQPPISINYQPALDATTIQLSASLGQSDALDSAILNLGLPYVANSGELSIRVDFNRLFLPCYTIVNLGLEELNFVLGSSQLKGLLLEAFFDLSE
ncbi:hypothetical protein CI238_11556 [Colletotrichum incanum]|uniref:Uncharacterized protein n=1 Tax=Colletotrichum incanum TaxID=1573173 RepID=A0A166LKU1_COLIC|nr:hypothetical protein CI238_11556 [Colletotrichum incanum]